LQKYNFVLSNSAFMIPFSRMKTILPALLLLLTLSSCFTIKPVEYKKTENIATAKTDSGFQMTFDLSMHNPNNWSLKLSNVETDVFVDNVILGKANLAEPIRLTRNSDFIIPMKATSSFVDLSKFANVGIGLLFGNKTATATIKGEITLKKFIFRKKYQFEYNEKIDAEFLQSLF
jgi:LEA14-like dessication related protein